MQFFISLPVLTFGAALFIGCTPTWPTKQVAGDPFLPSGSERYAAPDPAELQRQERYAASAPSAPPVRRTVAAPLSLPDDLDLESDKGQEPLNAEPRFAQAASQPATKPADWWNEDEPAVAPPVATTAAKPPQENPFEAPEATQPPATNETGQWRQYGVWTAAKPTTEN